MAGVVHPDRDDLTRRRRWRAEKVLVERLDRACHTRHGCSEFSHVAQAGRQPWAEPAVCGLGDVDDTALDEDLGSSINVCKSHEVLPP